MSSSFTVSRRGRIRKRVRSTLKRDDVFPPTISSPHAIVLLPDAGILASNLDWLESLVVESNTYVILCASETNKLHEQGALRATHARCVSLVQENKQVHSFANEFSAAVGEGSLPEVAEWYRERYGAGVVALAEDGGAPAPKKRKIVKVIKKAGKVVKRVVVEKDDSGEPGHSSSSKKSFSVFVLSSCPSASEEDDDHVSEPLSSTPPPPKQQQQQTLTMTPQQFSALFPKLGDADKLVAVDQCPRTSEDQQIFTPYLSQSALQQGLDSGKFYSGVLRTAAGAWTVGRVGEGIEVKGMANMNRALNGDVVVVELLKEDGGAAGGGSSDKGGLGAEEEPVEEDGGVEDKIASAPFEADGSAFNTKETDGPAEGAAAAAAPSADDRRTAKVVGVLQRNLRPLAGTLKPELPDKQMDTRLFIPVNPQYPMARVSTKNPQLLENKRILVMIDSWEADSRYPSGHWTRVLGEVGDARVEGDVILHEQEVITAAFSDAVYACLPSPEEFNNSMTVDQALKASRGEVVSEIEQQDEEEERQGGAVAAAAPRVEHGQLDLSKLKQIRSNPSACLERRDLTHLTVCSVDPPGCKDIDDALSCDRLPNGNFRVGVHIADVTHFVHPESAIDREAQKRCTTVYLVDRRTDMLPSLLTTDLCSLREGVLRYTFSVLWEVDSETGDVVSSEFTKGLIKSAGALTYQQAQELIDGTEDGVLATDVAKKVEIKLRTEQKPPAENDHTEQNAFDKLVESQTKARVKNLRKTLAPRLRDLNELAKKIRQKRFARGALELASNEVRFSGEDMAPSSYQSFETNKMVEEMMLLANSSVAGKIYSRFPSSALLRRHPDPREDALLDLGKLLESRLGLVLEEVPAQSGTASQNEKAPVLEGQQETSSSTVGAKKSKKKKKKSSSERAAASVAAASVAGGTTSVGASSTTFTEKKTSSDVRATTGFRFDNSKSLALSLDRYCAEASSSSNGADVNKKLIRMLATRCMNQAVYFCTGTQTPENFRHYGLAMDFYTHFTS